MCNFYKKKGHIKKYCFALKRKGEGKKNFQNNNHNNNSKAFYIKDNINVYTEKNNHKVLLNNVKEKCGEWTIDSGATSHFCVEKEHLQNFVELAPTEVLIGDKNAKSYVIGKGDTTFYVKENNRSIQIKLKNVLYAPNMRRNLISGACMDIAGFDIRWKNNKMEIYDDEGKYFFTAHRRERFYLINAYYEEKNEVYETSVSDNAVKMHRRFCHINMQSISHMEKRGIVRGIEKINNDKIKCDVCEISKATRSSFKGISSIMSQNILERIYMDVWGPSPVTSVGGGNYFLSIIDDYSRKVFVYVMKKKSEVFNFFKIFMNEVERQHDLEIKSVRTDNGMEFCHKEFEEFLQEKGIKIERTSTYTPEQNGVAERFNRTAIEGVRSMLQDSGLQSRFWAEALHNFVHVKNRSTHKLLKDCTPEERWWGKRPSVQHLRIFGSLAYVHTPRSKRNKLQANAQLGILVGYAVKTKGYRVWLPKSKQVIESVHVRIEESKNGVGTLFGRNTVSENNNNYVIKSDDDEEFLNEIEKDLQNENVTNQGEQDDNSVTVDVSKWTRVERPRKTESRVNVYYYSPGDNVRMRSINDVKKYFEEKGLDFDQENFCFKPAGSSSNEAEADSEKNDENKSRIILEEIETAHKEEVLFVDVPRTYEESQLSPKRDHWNAAMCEEIEMMNTREVWTLVDLPPDCKVIGNRFFVN